MIHMVLMVARRMPGGRVSFRASIILSLRIYELTKEGGQTKIEDVIRATSAARGTVKDHLNRLIKNGYLVQHGKGKETWYSLP